MLFPAKTGVHIDVDLGIVDPHNRWSLVAKLPLGSKGRPDLLRCNGLQPIEIFLSASTGGFRVKTRRVDRLKKFRQLREARQSGKKTREPFFIFSDLGPCLIVSLNELTLSMELSFVPPNGLRPERAST
jgi:hypothetical protein